MEVWMRLMLGSFAMLILGRGNKQLSQVAACHGQEGVPSLIRHPTLRSPKAFRKLYTLPTPVLWTIVKFLRAVARRRPVECEGQRYWALGLSKGGVWEARGFGSICARWPPSGTTSEADLARPCTISLEDIKRVVIPAWIDSASNAQSLVFAATKYEPASHYTLFSSALT